MKYIRNEEKNALLKRERGVGFEEIIEAYNAGYVLYDGNNDTSTYSHQYMRIVIIDGYPHKVPYKLLHENIYLITIYPIRKYKSLLLSS